MYDNGHTVVADGHVFQPIALVGSEYVENYSQPIRLNDGTLTYAWYISTVMN